MMTVSNAVATVAALPKQEPIITWATASAVFNALQLLALPGIPLWVHTVIVIVATVLSVIAARRNTVSTNNPQAVASVAKDLGIIEKVAKDV